MHSPLYPIMIMHFLCGNSALVGQFNFRFNSKTPQGSSARKRHEFGHSFTSSSSYLIWSVGTERQSARKKVKNCRKSMIYYFNFLNFVYFHNDIDGGGVELKRIVSVQVGHKISYMGDACTIDALDIQITTVYWHQWRLNISIHGNQLHQVALFSHDLSLLCARGFVVLILYSL